VFATLVILKGVQLPSGCQHVVVLTDCRLAALGVVVDLTDWFLAALGVDCRLAALGVGVDCRLAALGVVVDLTDWFLAALGVGLALTEDWFRAVFLAVYIPVVARGHLFRHLGHLIERLNKCEHMM
jgi:hypothetical protein